MTAVAPVPPPRLAAGSPGRLCDRAFALWARATAAAAFFLLFAGGMVTSTGSGLAVPDWPLSFGTLNPPMVGGIFFEHGHRLIAGGVALMTAVLALLARRPRVPAAARTAAWLAAGGVLIQAALGGLTVLLKLPPPSRSRTPASARPCSASCSPRPCSRRPARRSGPAGRACSASPRSASARPTCSWLSEPSCGTRGSGWPGTSCGRRR
ncbi:MAG: hypothetical protein M0D55_09285 [Elusimicrobiota bacterium]|nr:MAG: hypothetical protein M0D55_09285 [Elusimicrobiota bacterium]